MCDATNGDDDMEEVADLELESIIGFDGNTINGLQLHPDHVHIVYPFGMKVAIQNWKTKKQDFLVGHTNAITAVAISVTGQYVASGQINHMGFKACVILWDFATRTIVAKHEIHKVRVESVSFSCDTHFLVSLGGRDDGNVVVWDILKHEAMCGFPASPATAGDATVLCPMHVRDPCFVSAGGGALRVWKISEAQRKVRAVDVSFGMIKRVITCVVIDAQDLYAYCGTTTGDIVKVRLNYDHDPDVIDPVTKPVLGGCYGKHTVGKKAQVDGSKVQRWSRGVTALCLAPDEYSDFVVVGAGDGVVELVKEQASKPSKDPYAKPSKLRNPSEPQFLTLMSAHLCGEVTSLHKMGAVVIAGTALCEIYTISLSTFDVTLHVTCHTNMVHDIAFPHLYSDVFATCGKDDIRVWDSGSGLELLRITVPNFTCTCIAFTHDGKSIVSGWNDGEIRAFTPQKGRAIYTILNAHNRGVSAVAVTSNGRRIVSGGGEGQVRVWSISPQRQDMLAVLKEHKGPVATIRVHSNDEEAVSSSSDGTCIIWDIIHMVRKQVLFANTQFACAVYHPSGVQIITCGSDRKLCYWECYDGSLLRELDGSTAAALNAVDVSRDGNHVVSSGCDLYVKLWKYQDGITTHYGVGHAASVCRVKFSPDGKFLVSASADGAIFKWRSPCPLPDDFDDVLDDTASSHSSCSIREAGWAKRNSTPGSGSGRALKGVEVASKCSTPLLESVRKECRCDSKARGDAESVKSNNC